MPRALRVHPRVLTRIMRADGIKAANRISAKTSVAPRKRCALRLARSVFRDVFCAVLFCASANQDVFHLVFYNGGGIVRGTRAGGLEKRFKIAHIICAKPVDFWGKGAEGLFGVSRILARGFGGACHRLLLNEVAVFFVCGSLVSFHNLELEALPVVRRFLHVFGNSHVYESVWIFRKNFPQRLLSVGVRIGNLQFSVFKFHVPFSIYRHIRYPLPFRAFGAGDRLHNSFQFFRSHRVAVAAVHLHNGNVVLVAYVEFPAEEVVLLYGVAIGGGGCVGAFIIELMENRARHCKE